jgi:dihydrofolate synthase / folylpolyglutamate synthase
VSSTLSPAETWIESLSAWPEEFGLDGIHRLLLDLGQPQTRYPAIHVVGSNGKGTTTRTIEELLAAEGLNVGAYLSPHVRSWGERIRVAGEEAEFERAVERVRPYAGAATQFEVLTAAALAEFAEAAVDVAVVEAGLGGRYDATNVLEARVVVLTNVSLEHTDVLGGTREAIAREKLAVVKPGAVVVLGEPEWGQLVPDNEIVFGGAREAASAFLGRAVEREVDVALPGRLERHGDELWDGAHNLAGVEWLLERLPRRDYVLCVSILADKDVDGMLDGLSRAGRALVATRSSNPRAVDEKELAGRAERYFEHVEAHRHPVEALRRARELGPVLATGSLYLLADLSNAEYKKT